MMDQDEALSHFQDLTGTTHSEARTYLTTYNWQMDRALQAYYEDEDDDAPGSRALPAEGQDLTGYTGPRTLDGRPVAYSDENLPPQGPQRPNRTMTLDDLAAQEEEDAHDGDEPSRRRDLFAGGEKSGLAVQDPARDPRSLVDDIIAKARASAQQRKGGPSSAAGPSRSSHFTGTAQTLGGEGVPSRTIPGARGPQPIPRHTTEPTPPEQVTERILHIWEDGFSIDDGPLHRHDDPSNQETLRMINQGRVPLHLMNISYDEPVDVKLVKHEENWRQLPRVYRPFGGEGRRLGSPVPGDPAPPPGLDATVAEGGGASSSSSRTATTAATATVGPPSAGVDESQPTLMIRIQLPDGTRLPARFNTTQTIGDVYEFVGISNAATRSRSWVLATTFPNKEHIDRSVVLGEAPEFKKGGTAVVKWV